MNKEQMNQYVINSLESLQTLVNGVEGCDSTSLLLTETIDRINRSNKTPVQQPALFRHAPEQPQTYPEYDDYGDGELAEGEGVGDGYTLIPGDASYGIDPATGEEVNADTWAENIHQMNQALNDEEEFGFGEPLEPLIHFSVSYALADGELSNADVTAIINDPISETLNKFGKLAILAINPGESPAEKVVEFAVVEQGEFDLNAIKLGIASYQGRVPFPGIGVVTARASIPA